MLEAVGFIALAGSPPRRAWSCSFISTMRGKTTREGPRSTLAELVTAIEHRALNRVRPKLVTVLAIMLGLVPAFWSHGTGADVMKRIAAPRVGGMVTSTVLTLIVIPVLYCLWRRRQCTRQGARTKIARGSRHGRADSQSPGMPPRDYTARHHRHRRHWVGPPPADPSVQT